MSWRLVRLRARRTRAACRARAAQRDAVVGEHVLVVLDVLAELAAASGRSSQGLSRASTGSRGELLAARRHSGARAGCSTARPARPTSEMPTSSRRIGSSASVSVSSATACRLAPASSASIRATQLVVDARASRRRRIVRRRRVRRVDRRLARAGAARGAGGVGTRPSSTSRSQLLKLEALVAARAALGVVAARARRASLERRAAASHVAS